MARRRQNRFVSQAALEALVRYGPETSGLQALIREAEANRTATIRQARGTAQGITTAVNQARPQVAGVYRDAARNQRRIGEVVATDVAGLSGVADSIRAGLEWEQGSQASRLGESRADALTDLSQRKVAAQSGKQWAIQSAQREFQSETGKVLQRAQDLAREQGAFTAATARELRQAAMERGDKIRSENKRLSQQERNSIRSSGLDPDTMKPIPGGKLDPLAKAKEEREKKWAPAATQKAAGDTLGEALSEAKSLKSAGASRAEIAALLLRGAKDSEKPVYEEINGKQVRVLNPDGTPKMKSVPGLPKIKSQLLLSAALDIAFDGHLSRKNQRLLHDNGIRIGPLGVTTYRQWARERRKSRKKITRPPSAPGANGQLRPT